MNVSNRWIVWEIEDFSGGANKLQIKIKEFGPRGKTCIPGAPLDSPQMSDRNLYQEV